MNSKLKEIEVKISEPVEGATVWNKKNEVIKLLDACLTEIDDIPSSDPNITSQKKRLKEEIEFKKY